MNHKEVRAFLIVILYTLFVIGSVAYTFIYPIWR